MGEVVYSDGHRVVTRVGAPTAGGAFACYAVRAAADPTARHPLGDVAFQFDTIPTVGVQGWTNKALLAVILDRLRCFQASPYQCVENAEAILHVVEAIAALERRTVDRRARGVEGRHQP